MHYNINIKYINNEYNLTTEFPIIFSGSSISQNFIVDSGGTYFDIDNTFFQSSFTNDNILITIFDSYVTTIIDDEIEQQGYLNLYTTIEELTSTKIKISDEIPNYIYNNIKNDYSYKIRNLHYTRYNTLESLSEFINISPFKDIIISEYNIIDDSFILYPTNHNNIDYSLFDINYSEIDGSIFTKSITFDSDNYYYNYNLQGFLDDVFSGNTPVIIYNENYLEKDTYTIDELYDPTNNYDYPGGTGTWYPIQSSLYKIIPNDDNKDKLKYFKEYTYIDFGILEKENINVPYDYYSSGGIDQSVVSFDMNKSPYIINDSGRTLIVEVTEDYMLIEKPYIDYSSSGLTGGTNQPIGCYDIINVSNTSEISDILSKVYLNIDDDFYHEMIDSEKQKITNAYGQLLSENDLIVNNTTGLLYQDENNYYNLDLFNLDDPLLEYKPIEIYNIGIDKKTMTPIPTSEITKTEIGDEWFLHSEYLISEKNIRLYDNISTNENELYSALVYDEITTNNGITITLSFDITTTYTFNLKENSHYSTKIIWGDSTEDDVNYFNAITPSSITHIYQPGIYQLTSTGLTEALEFSGDLYIQEIISWGTSGSTNLKYINFEGCSNLVSLPYENGTNTLKNVITFNSVFKNTNIKSILFNIFKDCIATDYSNTFKNCQHLTYINSDLLSDTVIVSGISMFENTNILDFINIPTTLKYASYMFYNCQNLTLNNHLVPTNSDLIDMESMFENCNFSTIPNDFFINATTVTNMKSVFKNTPITSIPDTLFNISPNNILNMESMFENTQISNIPNGLFDTMTNVTTYEKTFIDCKQLNSLPANLFLTNTNVVNFNFTFKNTNITSAPSFYNLSNITSYKSTFEGSSLSLLISNMFHNNTSVIDFESTFKNTNISVIPSGLFDTTTSVINFKSTFDTTLISSIPNNLFDNNVDVTSFEGVFYGNNLLINYPEYIFKYNHDITTLNSAFRNCNISILNNKLLGTNTYPDLINIDDIFRNNNIINISAQIFGSAENILSAKNAFSYNNIVKIVFDLFYNLSDLEYVDNIFTNNTLVEIPSNIFVNNYNMISFYESFKNNPTIQETTCPNLWDNNDYPSVLYKHDCFINTGALGNNGSLIPISWGGQCSSC